MHVAKIRYDFMNFSLIANQGFGAHVDRLERNPALRSSSHLATVGLLVTIRVVGESNFSSVLKSVFGITELILKFSRFNFYLAFISHFLLLSRKFKLVLF